jgi:hypothetical protein
MAPPALDAATKARDAFFKKIAPVLKVEIGDLQLKGGQLWVKGEPVMPWKDACRKLGVVAISEIGGCPPTRKGSQVRESAAVNSPRWPSTSRRAW